VRALICIRLSRSTDATTSPERQLAKCKELCEQRGYEVVGVAEDIDVSAGSTSPFERPQLGDWLERRAKDFDVLVFFRADRIVRRLFDLADLIRWAESNSVTLVSATESHFDLSTDFGDILALLVAKVAEMELAAISERNASAAQYNIKAGKYRGGVPPWGYLPVGEKGNWRYVQDPEQVSVINEVVERVLKGEPLRAIAHDLTLRKIPTPRDRFAQSQGRAVKGYEWHSGPLKRALTSPTLMGQVVAREPLLDDNGRPVKDERGRKVFGPEVVVRTTDGSPVVRSEPILNREVFDRVCIELSDRENRKEPTKRSNGLLLRVAYCAVCGEPAYKLKGGKGRAERYRCKSASGVTACGGRSIKMELADSLVETAVLAYLGDSIRLERVWDSGSDNSAELAEIEARLLDMTDAISTSAFRRGTPQREKLLTMMSEIEARREKLAAQKVKKAGWEWSPTGEMFADWWKSQDVPARNIWLRSNGIRFHFDGEKKIQLEMGTLEELLKQLAPGETARRMREGFVEMGEVGIAGYEFHGLDEVTVHLEDGQQFVVDLKPHELTPEEEALAAEFYGWDKD
jgi:site-specific DNA recombinase